MKAKLQYCATDDGTYKDCGTLRTKKNQDYQVIPVATIGRNGTSELLGHKVIVGAHALTLNTDFLDETNWYFRLKFYDDLEMIKLGSREYLISYDAQIQRNVAEYSKILIEFYIKIEDYTDYAIPVALPESEGGIIVEDTNIYVE